MHFLTTTRRGFTLIEIAIVVIVIAMLIGGILVGRSLIRVAEMRALLTQMANFNSAVGTFRSKYNCLPGDCSRASFYGFDAATNGNGDGVIGLCSSVAACRWSVTNTVRGNESINFWYHLSAAGLIADPITLGGNITGQATPAPKLYSYIGGWGLLADAAFEASHGGGTWRAHAYTLGAGQAVPSYGIGPGYSTTDSALLDTKIDNGLPTSGSMRAFFSTHTNFASDGTYTLGGNNVGIGVGAGGSGAAVCIRNDTTPYQYNTAYNGTNSPGLCALVIKAPF